MNYKLVEVAYLDGATSETVIFEEASLKVCTDTIELKCKGINAILDEYIDALKGYAECYPRLEECFIKYEIYPIL